MTEPLGVLSYESTSEEVLRVLRNPRFKALLEDSQAADLVWMECVRLLGRMSEEALIHRDTIPNVVKTAELFVAAKFPREG